MKITAILLIAAAALFGSNAASAAPAIVDGDDPRETECAEEDTRPTDLDCTEIIDEETGDLIYPPVGGTGGTLPDTTTATTVPGELPATGSSGSIGLVQIGGLMLAGGLLVVVASRRRTPAATPSS